MHCTPPYPSNMKSSGRSSSEWKFTDSSTSMTVGTIFFVNVKVLSCLGSQPICSTRFPSFENAAERFDDVVDLPMPPLPYTAITSAPSIFWDSSRCT